MDGQDTRKFQIEAKIESHFHLFQERTSGRKKCGGCAGTFLQYTVRCFM